MFRTLHAKLSAVLLGLLSLIGLLYIPLCLFINRAYIQEVHQRLNRSLAEHLAEEKILLKDGRVDPAGLKQVIDSLMVINPNIEVYLLDPRGAILGYSAPPGKVKRRRVALEPVRRFLGGTDPLPILGDDPRHSGRRKVFSAHPVLRQGRLQGYVYVILGGEGYDSAAQMLQRSYILRLSLGMTAGILLFALAAGLLLFHLLTRRLRRLAAAMDAFQQGDESPPALPPYPSPVPPASDEIDRLGAVFDRMVARIRKQVRELQQVDTHRREMVSNVSHDLRTPLAALQGYLETLLMKEGQLTPDEQRNYLTTAAKHSDRLGKLVSELFELAKLDAREVQVHAEPFSPGELVQDVAQKFELAARNKKLTLRTSFAADLPFVCADIGLIERVLQNLIENALRYTPEGGAVTLALAPEGETIRVQVRDTGRGIREEDLPHIFERYYRVQNQPETPGCAGLGLAITKRILELHGSAIAVESAPHRGTTFTFHLPLCKTEDQTEH